MRKYFTAAVFFILTVSVSASDSRLAKHMSADLIVNDREQSGKMFIDWAESKGGYYLRYSDSGVILRIPDSNDEEINALLKKSGEILNYSFASENPQKEINVIKGRLSAREKLINDYYSLLKTSDFKSTLSLEKEISSVLREIEQLKGRLKKLEHDTRYAYMEINFISEDFYPENEVSSFGWINKIDFYDLMEEEPVE